MRTTIATFCIALVSAACGPAEEPMGGPEHEACEAVEMGSATSVTAGAAADASAPAVADHTWYEVALMASQAGYVRFTPEAAGDYVIFTSQSDAPTVTDESGGAVASESEMDVTLCSDTLSRGWTYPLQAGVYYLEFAAPATDSTVQLVIAESHGAGEDHH